MNDTTRSDTHELPKKYEPLLLSFATALRFGHHDPDMTGIIGTIQMLRGEGLEEEHSACTLVALAGIVGALESFKKRMHQLSEFDHGEVTAFYDQARNTAIKDAVAWLVYAPRCHSANTGACGQKIRRIPETTEFLHRLLSQHFPELSSFNDAL